MSPATGKREGGSRVGPGSLSGKHQQIDSCAGHHAATGIGIPTQGYGIAAARHWHYP